MENHRCLRLEGSSTPTPQAAVWMLETMLHQLMIKIHMSCWPIQLWENSGASPKGPEVQDLEPHLLNGLALRSKHFILGFPAASENLAWILWSIWAFHKMSEASNVILGRSDLNYIKDRILIHTPTYCVVVWYAQINALQSWCFRHAAIFGIFGIHQSPRSFNNSMAQCQCSAPHALIAELNVTWTAEDELEKHPLHPNQIFPRFPVVLRKFMKILPEVPNCPGWFKI